MTAADGKLLKNRSPEYYAACHMLLPINNTDSGSDKDETENLTLLKRIVTESRTFENTTIEDCTNKLINTRWWEDSAAAAKAKEEFDKYLTNREDKVIFLRGKTTGKPLLIAWQIRFAKSLRKEVVDKLNHITMKKGSFLHLTTDPKKFTGLLPATWALSKSWDRLRPSLIKHFKPVWEKQQKEKIEQLEKEYDWKHTKELKEQLTVERGKKFTFSYLKVTEFAPKHNLPHHHIVIDEIYITDEDKEWIRKLWGKYQGIQVEAGSIENVDAVRYALKYLNKVFNKSGKVDMDSNVWAYWVTNAKFYSISADLEPLKFDPEDLEAISDTEDVEEYKRLESGMEDGFALEDEKYEFLGVCRRSSLEKLPPKITDKWLLDHDFFYNTEQDRWVPPDIMEWDRDPNKYLYNETMGPHCEEGSCAF